MWRLPKEGYALPLFFLFVFTTFLMAPTPAQAGGWWQTNSTDSIGSGFWETQDYNAGYNSPHGGFVSSSNLCKTCHAVHMAGENSYRMLKSGNTTETRTQGEMTTQGMGNSRSTECMYCHDATSGATDRKPYELSPLGHTVRGEHTLGATAIPDSDVNNPGQSTGVFGRSDPATGQGAVLQCWQCHSVHGADTIGATNAVEGNIYNGSDSVENWNRKILRLDPAGDGSVLAKGSGGLSASVWQGQLDTDGAAVRTGFCADCHNQNPNWEIDSDDTTRPNNRSHPQGPGTDSQMEVYGTTKTVAAHPLERMGCRGCHYATIGAAGTGASRFPHQSVGWKLLFDEATMTGGSSDPLVLAGDPQRIIPKMDTICLSCHAVFEDIDKVAGTGLCFNCHASKYGAPNIRAETLKTYGMGITDVTRNHEDEIGISSAFTSPTARHAECYDCHNAKAIFPWEDTPLTGMWGITASYTTAGVPSSYSTTTQVANEYNLCFKCHSGWTEQPLSTRYFTTVTPDITKTEITPRAQGNKALEFNPNNSAFHPVQSVGRNQSANLNAQLVAGGLPDGTSTILKCTDCHNNNVLGDTGVTGKASNYTGMAPTGPHGSTNMGVLRANYNRDLSYPRSGYNSNDFELCFSCHKEELLVGPVWWEEDGGTGRTNFWDNALFEENLHWFHLVANGEVHARCADCHYNIHSNQQATNTQYRINPAIYTDGPPASISTHLVNFAPHVKAFGSTFQKPQWRLNADNSRSCNLRCHRADGSDSIMGYPYETTTGDQPYGL